MKPLFELHGTLFFNHFFSCVLLEVALKWKWRSSRGFTVTYNQGRHTLCQCLDKEIFSLTNLQYFIIRILLHNLHISTSRKQTQTSPKVLEK